MSNPTGPTATPTGADSSDNQPPSQAPTEIPTQPAVGPADPTIYDARLDNISRLIGAQAAKIDIHEASIKALAFVDANIKKELLALDGKVAVMDNRLKYESSLVSKQEKRLGFIETALQVQRGELDALKRLHGLLGESMNETITNLQTSRRETVAKMSADFKKLRENVNLFRKIFNDGQFENKFNLYGLTEKVHALMESDYAECRARELEVANSCILIRDIDEEFLKTAGLSESSEPEVLISLAQRVLSELGLGSFYVNKAEIVNEGKLPALRVRLDNSFRACHVLRAYNAKAADYAVRLNNGDAGPDERPLYHIDFDMTTIKTINESYDALEATLWEEKDKLEGKVKSLQAGKEEWEGAWMTFQKIAQEKQVLQIPGSVEAPVGDMNLDAEVTEDAQGELNAEDDNTSSVEDGAAQSGGGQQE